MASGLIGAVIFGLLSAFFPPLNAEIYAVAAPVIFPDMWVLHVSAMTGGLVIGKITHFVAAAKGADAISKRREDKESRAPRTEPLEGPPTFWRRVRDKLTEWSKAMIDVLDRPRLGPLVILSSSGIGFPPLAVVVVAAGVKRISATVFVGVMTIGCLARFLITAWLVQEGIDIGF